MSAIVLFGVGVLILTVLLWRGFVFYGGVCQDIFTRLILDVYLGRVGGGVLEWTERLVFGFWVWINVMTIWMRNTADMLKRSKDNAQCREQ